MKELMTCLHESVPALRIILTLLCFHSFTLLLNTWVLNLIRLDPNFQKIFTFAHCCTFTPWPSFAWKSVFRRRGNSPPWFCLRAAAAVRCARTPWEEVGRSTVGCSWPAPYPEAQPCPLCSEGVPRACWLTQNHHSRWASLTDLPAMPPTSWLGPQL